MHVQSCSPRLFDSFLVPLSSVTANHCVGYSKLWRHSPRLFWLNHCRCAHKSNQLIAIPTDTSQLSLYAVLVELRVGNDVELMGLFDGLCPNVFVNGGTPDAVAVGLNGAFSALDLACKVFPFSHETLADVWQASREIRSERVLGEDGRFTWEIVPDWLTTADTISLSLAIVRLQDGSFTRFCRDELSHFPQPDEPGNVTWYLQGPPETFFEDDPPVENGHESAIVNPKVDLDFTFAPGNSCKDVSSNDLHLEFGVISFDAHHFPEFYKECEHLIFRDWSHCEWI